MYYYRLQVLYIFLAVVPVGPSGMSDMLTLLEPDTVVTDTAAPGFEVAVPFTKATL